MRQFTVERTPRTEDEIWLVEHPPVFTMGLAGVSEHILSAGTIPVERTERGGQVTYHGPGQVLAYLLVDLKRAQILVRDFVCRMETAVIQTLASFQVSAQRKPAAPGVYLSEVFGDQHLPGAKISALGIKVSRGCTYHGLALNIAMDLEPFLRINPCGYPGLKVTDLRTALRDAATTHLSLKSDEMLIAESAAQLGKELLKALDQGLQGSSLAKTH